MQHDSAGWSAVLLAGAQDRADVQYVFAYASLSLWVCFACMQTGAEVTRPSRWLLCCADGAFISAVNIIGKKLDGVHGLWLRLLVLHALLTNLCNMPLSAAPAFVSSTILTTTTLRNAMISRVGSTSLWARCYVGSVDGFSASIIKAKCSNKGEWDMSSRRLCLLHVCRSSASP